MPNLLHEFMSESSTYMKLRSIYTDAKTIRESIMGSYQTATQRVDEMSRTNPYLRKTRQWFEQQRIGSGHHTTFEYDDTEFDSGVHAPNSKAEQYHVSASEYKELIASKQAEIAKINEKQLQGQMLNHAEVMMSMDKRNAEVVASLAKSSDILNTISAKLDKLIQTRMSVAEKVKKINTAGAYNANGMLTIQGAMDYFSNGLVARASKMTFKQAMVERVDQAVSERVSNFQTELLTKFLDSPAVKKLIGDPLHSQRDKDYSRFIRSEYDRSPAIFDNATRKSIVDVIPGYLKRITYAVTDKMYHVSKNGELTLHEQRGSFADNIDATFDISSFKDETFNTLSSKVNHDNRKVSTADIKEAHRAIVSQYTLRLYQTGNKGIPASAFKNGLSHTLIRHVASLLNQTKGRGTAYWLNVLQDCSLELQMNTRYRNQLAGSISRSIHRFHEMSIKAAKASDHPERMQYTKQMFDERARKRLSVDSTKFEHDGKTLRQLIREKVIKKESLSAYQLAHLDDVINNFAELQDSIERGSEEYSSRKLRDILQNHNDIGLQIFKMLNRGINVYVFPYVDTPAINIGAMSIPDAMMPTPVEFQKPKRFANTIDTSNIAKTLNKVLPSTNSKKNNFVVLSNYDKDESNSDAERSNEILASMTTSAKNGNISESDAQALSAKINEIQSPTMQATVKRVVDGVISRTKSKSLSESPIGKAFMFVFGLAKTGLSKLFKGAKFFFTEIVSRGAKILADSFGKVVRGAQGIFQGLFGSEESYGIIRRPIMAVKNAATAINNRVVKPIANKLKPVTQKVKPVAKKAKDTVAGIMDQVQEVAANFANKLTGKITDFIKKSQFGQGFMSVMEKKKRIPAQTMADDKIDEMLGLVNNDKKPSALQTLVFNLTSTKDTIEEWITMKIDGIEEAHKKRSEKNKKDTEEDEDPTSQKSLGFDLGKVLGGITSMLGGIMQAALTVILSMEAVKNIMALGKDILQHALQPLNKLFQRLLKVLKPIAEMLTKIIKEIVNDVVQIVEVLVEIVKPVFELIGPLFEQIMEALKPILDMITGLIDVLMVPLTVTMKTVVVPILQTVGNVLEIIGGVVQLGLGMIITALGGILMGMGMMGKFFSKTSVYETGQQMFEMGTNLVKSGASSIVSGMKKQVETIGSYYKGLATAVLNPSALLEDEEPQQTTKRRQEPQQTYNGSPMEGLYGSGDDNAPYKFDDDVQEAFSNLKNIVSSIFNIFNADSSTDLEKKLNDAEEASKYDQAKIDTSGMTEEEIKEIDDRAFELFKNSTTSEQLHGESDEEYRKRFEKNKAKWWTIAATEKLHTKVKSVADGNDAGAINMINESMGEYDSETGTYKKTGAFANSMFASLDSVDSNEFERLNSDLVTSMYTSQQSYGDDEYYWEGGTGDIIKAASETFVATRKAAGHYLQQHGETVRNVQFDDGMTIDIVSAMCTGMLAAIVKRMGYYLPANGRAYTDTYQGDPYMTPTIGANSWGLDNADGHPNIYNRDGTKSTDWTIVKDGSFQSGDLTFAIKSAGAVHGHMPVFQNDSGYWFGFNGGRYDSRENSVRLGEYYLKNGGLPPGSNPGIQTEGSPYDQQIGATASPLTYKIRYTGPKTKGRRRVKKSGSGSSIGGSKDEWIKTVAMMFEGYYFNGDKYYDNVNTHTFQIRDGRTVKARPDCSGMLGAAMTAMGYKLDYPPSSTHYNVTGCNGNLNFIHDPDGSISKDWQLIKFNGHNLEPGDITGNTAHASFPITDLSASFPKGMDAGGTSNIRESAMAARAYLNGERSIPWRSAMGSGSFTKVGGAQNIVRYVGGRGSTSSTTTSRTVRTTASNSGSTALTGSSNAEKIWNYFRGKGLTKAGTAGLMGNLSAESALRPNNLEDTREGQLGSDAVYTSKVDSGAYKNFTKDNAGYGLAQWTVSDRKSPLYQYKVSRNKSIGDLGMQLDFLNTELTGKFPGILSVLKSTSDINAASDKVLKEFERPRVLNYDARRNLARQFYSKYGGGDEDVDYTGWVEQYDPSAMESLASTLRPIQEHQDPSTMLIPEIQDWKFDEDPQPEETVTPIIVNQYANTEAIQDYIDGLLSYELEIDAPVIKQLMDDIMVELPEYLEDDDDDDSLFTEEDDMMIQALVAAFM